MKLNYKYHFDSAHRLEEHKGLCKNIHGHRWQIEVEIKIFNWEVKDMIIDFSNLKEIINDYDHKLILKNCYQNEKLIKLCEEENLALKIIPLTPTAENLSKLIYEDIENKLKELYNNFLIKVVVYESPNSSIIYEV